MLDATYGGSCPCPGLPIGNIVLLEGESGVGKTRLALLLSSNVCRSGGSVVYLTNREIPEYLGTLSDSRDFVCEKADTLWKMWRRAREAFNQGTTLLVLDALDDIKDGIEAQSFAFLALQQEAQQSKTCVVGVTRKPSKPWRFLPHRRFLLEAPETGGDSVGYTLIKDCLDVGQGHKGALKWSSLVGSNLRCLP